MGRRLEEGILILELYGNGPTAPQGEALYGMKYDAKWARL